MHQEHATMVKAVGRFMAVRIFSKLCNKSNIPRRNLCMSTACRNNLHAILILQELQRNNLDEDSIINLKELRGVFKNVSYM